jgi:crotonobetainyl-CoA:carnitine CoA-transferase CaiB-like acyl-CoA transferase
MLFMELARNGNDISYQKNGVKKMISVLDGVKVLCFGMGAASPLATSILGDFGAEVIKIEPLTGDWARNTPGLGLREFNRNKKSIAVDIKTARGAELVKELIKACDILVEGFRPGVMNKLGFSYEDAKALNPQIIYCSVSAYGQTGPWQDKPGVDGIMQASSGIMSVLGSEGENKEPIKVPFPIADMTAGLIAAQGLLLGIIAKQKYGIGQYIDVSLLEASLVMQKSLVTRYLPTRKLPRKTGSAAPYSTPNEVYRTKDGHIMLAAYHPKRWQSLCCEVLNRPELTEDPRFNSEKTRVEHRKELKDIIESVLTKRTTGEWLETFEKNDLLFSPVNNYDDVMQMEQVKARNVLETVTLLDGTVMETISAQPRMSETPGVITRPYPELAGQHSREILNSFGFSKEEIKMLEEEKIIKCYD